MYNLYIRGSPFSAIGAFPENPTEDNFREKLIPESYSLSIFGIIWLIYGLTILISLFLNHKKCSSVYIISNFVISLMFCNTYNYSYEDYNICNYPFSYERGINNTLLTGDYYYAILKSEREYCPDMGIMINYFIEKNDIDDKDCNVSEFGCCRFNEMLYYYSKLDFSFSIFEYDNEYIDDYVFTYNMDKKDDLGTNCIKNNRHDYFKVIDTYLDKKYNEDNSIKLQYILVYIIFYILIHVSICGYEMMYNKEKKYDHVDASQASV
tara:strand:- start:297 stop:1091 length:795 start_codon:yes stop_codon:yes gene_type:complete